MAFVTIRIAVGLLRERTKREDEADPSAHAQAQRSTVHLKCQWKYARCSPIIWHVGIQMKENDPRYYNNRQIVTYNNKL